MRQDNFKMPARWVVVFICVAFFAVTTFLVDSAQSGKIKALEKRVEQLEREAKNK